MEEDKIEVGEFVRCKNGKIAKIKDVENEFIYFDTEIYWRDGIPIFECETCFKDFIVKHSKNKNDLVQTGDIVIYSPKGLENCQEIHIVKEYPDARTLGTKLRVGIYSLEQLNIKSILSKEQFECSRYDFEED